MQKNIAIIICIIISAAISPADSKSEIPQPSYPASLLREGFAFSGIDGTVTRAPGDDKWIFTTDVELTDNIGTLKKNESIELLPSSTLEKIISDAENSKIENPSIQLRIWGTVMTYSERGKIRQKFSDSDPQRKLPPYRNFLFPANFVPMTVVETADETEEEPAEPAKPEKDTKSSIIPEQARKVFDSTKKDEPQPNAENSNSVIPPDIMKMLKPKRRVDFEKWRKTLDIEGDFLLVNRTGFVNVTPEKTTFSLDALGRKIDSFSFRLLPCQVVQETEQRITNSFGRQRYKIAGTITKYKGEYYLLPQNAARTYSHENFAR